jgi:hypothetical protein
MTLRLEIAEFADTSKPRELTPEAVRQIAARYKQRKAERHAEGKSLPPLSVFMARILMTAAVDDDR